ncbi:hypothetical protein ACRE_063680 [Hapsidospora chrysogenum ATCC 11550]|uniref:Uncharacterized protein n=1 Tax=Hapsidospora chrysogenum (strain ATCC 11550 / CBS 779.69 / DSM 880 / IAM 14645 / JCM 23072 / IMI 49137) TaxID=857340 RepID=A0A086T0M7_HAPC1|nr:hypothetical protein ACRE_063680 [Hapsidospora chrysogenum ATCC 11550]
MKLVTHLLTLALALQGVSATSFFSHNNNHVGLMLESRANGKMPSYQQVLAASLKRYPGMKAADTSGKFRYNLKPCNDKCEKKNEVKDENGDCKPCPKGQKPDKDQTKCVPERKEQGKCENGKVLDPAAGGQDANTENPKCISDDDDKCPQGQTAASRRKGRDVDESTYEPSCAVDEDPDFKCDDPNTYDHKTILDDKIKHSCRSTRKHEDDKKKKYDERVQVSRTNKDSKSGDLEKERRKKNRSGWCFVAVASLGLFDFAEEIEALTDMEIEGMYAHFPEDAPDPSGDGSIPNYVVSLIYSVAGQIQMEGAGPGAVVGAIPKIVGAIKGSTTTSAAVKNIRSGSTRGPSSTAKTAASKSDTIRKIFKNEHMLDCVFTAAAVAGVSKRQERIQMKQGPYSLSIDWSRTEEMSKPAPDGVQITLRYDDHEDRLYKAAMTYNDGYHHWNGLSYEACQRPLINNGIVSLQVEGGCCAFYDGDNCESDTHMFDMENREHGDLQGDHRGTISSFWCTANPHCAGKP